MPLARHDYRRHDVPTDAHVSTHMPLARHDVIFNYHIVLDKFLLTCLLRGMTPFFTNHSNIHIFLLTCLLRGMTKTCVKFHIPLFISTHMPLARHDISSLLCCPNISAFLLTCLLRGMTQTTTKHLYSFLFLLTCLLRGMTDDQEHWFSCTKISTHMPLARHDVIFNYHIVLDKFLLTCLLRGMTPFFTNHSNIHIFLLTCLLRGMTKTCVKFHIPLFISTHMPLARHDSYTPTIARH